MPLYLVKANRYDHGEEIGFVIRANDGGRAREIAHNETFGSQNREKVFLEPSESTCELIPEDQDDGEEHVILDSFNG